MSTKNPFEIRLELLKMAKEMMDRQYEEASAAYSTTVYTMAEKWNEDVNVLLDKTKEMAPVMYSPTEIMEKAQELYSFVSKKD
jgi:hypothetical protein